MEMKLYDKIEELILITHIIGNTNNRLPSFKSQTLSRLSMTEKITVHRYLLFDYMMLLMGLSVPNMSSSLNSKNGGLSIKYRLNRLVVSVIKYIIRRLGYQEFLDKEVLSVLHESLVSLSPECFQIFTRGVRISGLDGMLSDFDTPSTVQQISGDRLVVEREISGDPSRSYDLVKERDNSML